MKKTSDGKNNIIRGDIENLYVINADLAVTFLKKGDLNKALLYFKKAYDYSTNLSSQLSSEIEVKSLEIQRNSIKSNIIDILLAIGDKYFNNKLYEKALEYSSDILNYETTNTVTYEKMSRCLIGLKFYSSAVCLLEKILLLDKNRNDLNKALAEIYKNNLNQPELAIKYYKEYLKNESDKALKAEICNTIGVLYDKIDKYKNIDLQIKYFKKAYNLNPKLKIAIRNLAVGYNRNRNYKNSIKYFNELFKYKTADINDYYAYSLLLLKMKNFKEGSKYFEYRFYSKDSAPEYPDFKQPRWKGEDLTNKTLLVQFEGGFGDSFQFFRYLHDLKNLNGKILFRTQKELSELIRRNSEGIEVIDDTIPIENIEFDYHLPLGSIIYTMGAKADEIPLAEGYITPDQTLVQKYKDKFFDNNCTKIGIAWSGDPRGLVRRNIPLEAFYPLAKLENVKLYSFQKGQEIEELKTMPNDFIITNLGATFKDFSDTAAAMQNLDIFITSDNCLLNLAGAMGKKTFLLLNQDSEWRWFDDTKSTPWYNSVEIFKKDNELDSWSTLFDVIIKKLAN